MTTSPFTADQFNLKRLSFTVMLFMTTFFSVVTTLHATEQQAQIKNNTVDKTSVLIARSVGQLLTQKNTQNIMSTKLPESSPITLGKTRAERLLIKKQAKQVHEQKLHAQEKNTNNVVNVIRQSAHIHDFSIYRAFSYLLEDIDEDDYYQSFSIVFDADVYQTAYAEVYAELYLRKEGGPWIHYYSSDIFALYGESEDDEFEVVTTLEQGFTSNFYDVLIDLYEANSDELVASYSADDNNALYALALESSDYDEPYIDVEVTEVEIIHSNGGSLTLLTLLMTFMLALFRYIPVTIQNACFSGRKKRFKQGIDCRQWLFH
jgi:hypothetical protein